MATAIALRDDSLCFSFLAIADRGEARREQHRQACAGGESSWWENGLAVVEVSQGRRDHVNPTMDRGRATADSVEVRMRMMMVRMAKRMGEESAREEVT